MINRPFIDLSVSPATPPRIKRRYSVTADVAAYQRCARQYGAFHIKNFASSRQRQVFFGQVLHQVLDRFHHHYQGRVDATLKGRLPDDGGTLSDAEVMSYFEAIKSSERDGVALPEPPSQILAYFREVELGLISQGLNKVSAELRLRAVQILQNFNALEGARLYPKILDTEHRLRADQGHHILHGVVDLLTESTGEGQGGDEMWDYKGVSRAAYAFYRESYHFQMQVYAHLYRLKHGALPSRVVLYLLGELDGSPPPTTRPVNAVIEIPIDEPSVARAMEVFNQTVGEIERSRAQNRWPAAPPEEVTAQDCKDCDLRWDCSTFLERSSGSRLYP